MLAAVLGPREKNSWKSSLSARDSTTLLFRNVYGIGNSCFPVGRQFCWSSNMVYSYQVCNCKEVLKSQIILLLFLRSSLNFISFFFPASQWQIPLSLQKYVFFYHKIVDLQLLDKSIVLWNFAGVFTCVMYFHLLLLDVIFQPGESWHYTQKTFLTSRAI